MTKPNQTAAEIYAAAAKAVRDGEAMNLSESTMARRYRAMFAAEDVLKSQNGGGW